MSGVSPHVLHVPHASRDVPADLRPSLLLDDEGLERELDRLTDHATDRIFRTDAFPRQVVRFPVSRLAVDPERFEDDAHEPQASHGMGVIYTRTSDGRRLREPPSAKEREALLARFYRPHHGKLHGCVKEALSHHGYCLIVDAHSFPDEPLPYETPTDRPRPDVCLGTDPFHTPPWLVDLAVNSFECAETWSVAVDHPFSGSMVPAAYYRRDNRVFSLMVEVHRDLYWDQTTQRPNAGFTRTQLGLHKALSLIRGRVGLRFMR